MNQTSSLKLQRAFVSILKGCDLSRRRLPRLALEAIPEGPVVWLTACAHGDEVGGIVVVHEVIQRLRTHLMKGSIHAFPLMNPIGFDVCSRHVTLSEEDLNRCFPGDAKGSLGERIARKIFDTILATKPSLVLDLHNDWTRTIPYVVLDALSQNAKKPEQRAQNRAREYAAVTDFPVVEEGNPLRRTLSHTLILSGIPALTIELGESRVVNETAVQLGVEAICAILEKLHMVDGAGNEHPTTELEFLRYSNRPLCSTSGILRFQCDPGPRGRVRDPLARVVDALGRPLEMLRAGDDALVLGVADSSVAYPGAPAVALGVISDSKD